MYMKQVSVAEARNSLPALIHQTARGPIEIVRRGKPVAVLISREEFDRVPFKHRFYDAMIAWRAENSGDLENDDWLPPRERRPGRESPKW